MSTDNSPPLLWTTSPADNTAQVPYGENQIVLHFNEPIHAGVGTIKLVAYFQTVDIPIADSSQVNISDDTLTIDAWVLPGEYYTVQLPIGIVDDLAGNAFDGSQFSFSVEDPFPPTGVIDVSIQIPSPSMIGNDVPIDMTAWDPLQFQHGTIISTSATTVEIRGATDGLTYRIIGRGLSTTATSYDQIGGTKDELAVFDDRTGIHHFLYAIDDFSGGIHLTWPDMPSAATIFGGNNEITGSSANDLLEGFGGGNTLSGLQGNDTLIGSSGGDILDGGPGVDLISGGAGVDTFRVSQLSDLAQGDEVTNFETADRVDLSAVAGLHFIGASNFSGLAGQVNYVWGTNSTTLQIDVDGDRNPDKFLKLNGGNFILGETGAGSGIITASLLLTDSSPANNEHDLLPWTDIVLTFNKDVVAGQGDIVIHKASDGSTAATIDITDASQVHIAGNTVTINPVNDLAQDAAYYVTMPSGTIYDHSGNTFAGLTETPLDLFFFTDTPPINGDAGDNSISGTNGNDYINGLGGNDSIFGAPGNDTITGGDGADFITDLQGSNSLDGGNGDDSFYRVSDNWDANFNGVPSAPGNDTITGGAGQDLYTPIVYLPSQPMVPDTITDFQTGAGGDLVDISTLDGISLTGYSYDMNPFVTGYLRFTQSGTDSLLQIDTNGPVGGANWSTILIFQHTTTTTFTADNIWTAVGVINPDNFNPQGTTGVLLTGDDGNNNLFGSANFDTIIGNGGNDNISAGAGDDSVSGGDGNDSLDGFYGNDVLVGGAGFNAIFGDDGNDTISGGDGSDLNGGRGNDSLVGNPNQNVVADYQDDTGGLSANLATGFATGTISGNDTLSGIQNLNGGAGNDTLTGDDADNALNGYNGNDSLSGGNGDDLLIGGPGNDTLDGGAGVDNASYSGATSGVKVDLTQGSQNIGGGMGTDSLLSIERLFGSSFDDTLIGNASDNHLFGANGNDRLQGGAGNDALDGGDGTDTAYYGGETLGVNANLVSGMATSAAIGTDQLIRIENLTGGNGSDTLIGDGGNNSLRGGLGRDSLSGGGGDDTLSLGFGADVFGLTSGDTLDGGSGADQLVLFDQSLTILFAPGTISNLEQIAISTFVDTYTQQALVQNYSLTLDDANVAAGASLTFLPNTIWNPASTLFVDGSAESDGTFAFGGTSGVDTFLGGSGNDNASGLQGNDSLSGNGGNDTLVGGDGNDRLSGGGGNDLLDGGIGIDTAVFSGIRASYSIVATGTQVVVSGPDGADTLSRVERLEFSDITVNLHKPGGDFSGDGKSDFLWQHDDGRASLWLIDGKTMLTGFVIGPEPGPTWHIKGAGDFNGDGNSDVLWQNNDGRASLWLMNGTTLLNGVVIGPEPGPTWHVKGAGDFNGDGKSDVLWQADDGRASLWLMNGTTLLTGVVIGPEPGPTWHVKGAGDFNGDGKSDVLWQNDDGRASIWLMDGTTMLTGSVIGPEPGPTWHVKGTGDFNGDGKSDVLWQNDDGRASVWLMNGTTMLTGSVIGPEPGTSWHVEGTGDYNGDGKSDVAWQNDDGRASVWLMDGTSLLDGEVIGPNPGPAWHIEWA